MKLVNRFRFFIGVSILVLLLFGYFLTVEVDSGTNYTVTDSLLGVLIFHNFFVLIVYLFIAGFFIFTGFKRIKIA